MNTKPRMIVAAMALATALAISSTGFAQSPTVDNSASRTVRYSDLNLSTPEGVQILYRRIARAAASTCQMVAASPYYVYVQCMAAATDEAVSKANNPYLTALHHGTKPRALIAAR